MSQNNKAKILFGGIALLGACAVSIQSSRTDLIAILGIVGLGLIVWGVRQ